MNHSNLKDRVDIDAFYPHSPERVWQAITDSEALSQWLMPTDFQPLIGFRFRLDRPNGSPIQGKVTDLENARLLAYTWRDEDEGESSMVVWTLEPVDGGTRLRVQHLALKEPAITCLAIDTYFNWQYALRHSLPGLLRLLEAQGRSPKPPMVYVEEVMK